MRCGTGSLGAVDDGRESTGRGRRVAPTPQRPLRLPALTGGGRWVCDAPRPGREDRPRRARRPRRNPDRIPHADAVNSLRRPRLPRPRRGTTARSSVTTNGAPRSGDGAPNAPAPHRPSREAGGLRARVARQTPDQEGQSGGGGRTGDRRLRSRCRAWPNGVTSLRRDGLRPTAPLIGAAAVVVIAAVRRCGADAGAGHVVLQAGPVLAAQGTGQLASGALLGFGALLFLAFAAIVYSTLRRAGGEPSATAILCLAGGVIVVVALTIEAGPGTRSPSETSLGVSTRRRCRRSTC